MKNIGVVTGTRAEYGILYPLLKKLQASDHLDLKLFVTGMHLSPSFGLTYKNILRDGFDIHEKIEMLVGSDTATGVSKSIGMGIIGFADCFGRYDLDMLLVLGDRFETYSSVVAAYIARIPVVHLHGGELTEGLIDEGIRHSITKMSSLHFASTEVYKKRIIQLGEQPSRVYNVGALGVENIKNISPMSKQVLEKDLNFTLDDKTFVVTYHPVTLDKDQTGQDISCLLDVLEERSDLRLIFTMPNADTNGRVIIDKINAFVEKNSHRCMSTVSLGRNRYLSVMNHIGGVIGNSSSGLIEVPSFAIPTINIGKRQMGRVSPETVIDCDVSCDAIDSALSKALSEEFRMACKGVENPYDGQNTADKILEVLEGIKLSDDDVMKKFYDIKKDW